MENYKSFNFVLPMSVFGKLGYSVFASVCRQANSELHFVCLSDEFDNCLLFRVESPDLLSANAAMNRLSDFRLNLIRNGYCRRHWHFGPIVDSLNLF